MAQIDFDRLRQWLTAVAPLFGQIERIKGECETLRQDYIGRVSGMMKAVAAVRRSDAGLESIAGLLESLPQMSAAELVRQYRRRSAEFRDTFGVSFGHLGPRRGELSRSMNPELYK